MSSYNTNPLCGFTFTTSGFINLFQLLKSAFIKDDWNPQNSSLPIFLIAGVDDPVIQGKQKFNELEEFLKEVGYEISRVNCTKIKDMNYSMKQIKK